MESRRRILFIINPVSGGNTKQQWEQAIQEQFRQKDFQVEWFLLNGQNDRDSIRHWIQKFRPETVVAVGGDGTISLVADTLLHTGIALGILPAGSSNGMARELAIPNDTTQAMHIIAAGKTAKADVIRINDRYTCLHLSDIGLNARLIKYYTEGTRRGKLGYAAQVIKTLWTKSPMLVKVHIDGREKVHKALMVVLANASQYGTGAVINPQGNPFDGKFEVVVVKKLAVSELLKMWFRPQPFDPEKILQYQATAVSIHTRGKVHFQVDGEYLGQLRHLEASVLPGQLKLIVPE